MKLKIFYWGALFLLAAVAGTAQDKKRLGLNETIQLSIQNSKALKADQAKIEEATASLREAIDRRLPDASVTGSYMRLNSANIAMAVKNNNGGGNTSAEPDVSQAMYGILNLSLPVYSGGRIRYGIESARFLQKAVALDAELDKEQVIQTALEAFANLFKARTAVSLVKENLVQSAQRVKDLENMEKNGLLARNDLLKAQLQQADLELSLLDAENNWKLANINMDLMLGLPTETELEPDTMGIARKTDTRILEDYIQAALLNRKDKAAIGLRKQAAGSGIKAARGEYFPAVQLTGGYIAADIPGLISITNALNIGIGVNYSIGSLWKTKAKVQQAAAKEKQWAQGESQLDDKIRLQVNKDYLALLSSRKKIDVYAKSVEQADENYRIVKNKFTNSLATLTDLLEADVAQLKARLSYTLSRADAFVAYHKLLQTAGLLAPEFIQ